MNNKKTENFIGVDVSKATIDVAIIKDNNTQNIQSYVLSNDKTGFKELKKPLVSYSVIL